MIIKFKKHSFIFNDILSLIIENKYLLIRTKDKTTSIFYSKAGLKEIRSHIVALNELRKADIERLEKRQDARYAKALNIFMLAGDK